MQVAERRDERRHVGKRRRIQHAVHAGDFLARLHHAHLLQDDLRAPRSVELHRQRDQLKREQDQIAVDAERDQAR